MIYTAVIISKNLQPFKELERSLKEMNFEIVYQISSPYSVDQILKFSPQLIVVDNKIENVNSLTFCNEVRNIFNDLLVLISDKADNSYQEFTLNMGLDASLSWMLGESLVNANILALVRRFIIKSPIAKLHFGNLIIDKTKRDAFIDSKPLHLSTMEFKTIWFLAYFSGEVISRSRLHQGIYDQPYNGFDRSIDLYVSRIRQKIGDSPTSSTYLKTIRGVGYQFIPGPDIVNQHTDTN